MSDFNSLQDLAKLVRAFLSEVCKEVAQIPLCTHYVFQLDTYLSTSQWRHNGCYGVSNHQPHECLLKRLFRRRSKKTSKLRVTDLWAGNSPVTLPALMASNAKNVFIWWRHNTDSPVHALHISVRPISNLGLLARKLSMISEPARWRDWLHLPIWLRALLMQLHALQHFPNDLFHES